MKKISTTILLILSLTLQSFGQNSTGPFSQTDLENYLANQSFSGAVLVKNSEGEIAQMVSGTTNENQTQVMNPDARFRIASITKLFTAVIIMQLADEGKLTLTSTVSEFLNYNGIAHADKITVKDLLQHTSGLQKESNASYLKAYSPDELIEKFATKKAKEPGQEHFYNNVDFLLLGRIIEVTTGNSFEENLKSRILAPLEMKNSGLITTHALPEGIVPDFKVKNGNRRESMKIHVENFWAAGSMYSTASDLLRFAEALKKRSLLSEQSTKELFTSSASLGYVALGCWTFNSPFINGQPRIMERRGEILGSTSALMTHLDGPETVIVLSNTNEFRPETFGVSDNLKEYLFKKAFD